MDKVRPDTSDPLWNFTFDRIQDIHADLRTLKDDVRTVQIDMGNLRETTNHRLDEFTSALNSKAEKRELLIPVITTLLNRWWKRFIAFIAGLAAFATGLYTLIDFFKDKF